MTFLLNNANIPTKRWIYPGACWLLGGLFIYAGIIKAISPLEFADSIAAFELLPPEIINLVALSLPILEIVSGFLLITGWQRRLGTFCILCLTLVFAAAIISALARGLNINCACFGEDGVPTRFKLWLALGRDALLFGFALCLYGAGSSISPGSLRPKEAVANR